MPSLPSTQRRVPSGHGMKSSILYLHSPTVRPKYIVRLSEDPPIQDSLSSREASLFLFIRRCRHLSFCNFSFISSGRDCDVSAPVHIVGCTGVIALYYKARENPFSDHSLDNPEGSCNANKDRHFLFFPRYIGCQDSFTQAGTFPKFKDIAICSEPT